MASFTEHISIMGYGFQYIYKKLGTGKGKGGSIAWIYLRGLKKD